MYTIDIDDFADFCHNYANGVYLGQNITFSADFDRFLNNIFVGGFHTLDYIHKNIINTVIWCLTDGATVAREQSMLFYIDDVAYLMSMCVEEKENSVRIEFESVEIRAVICSF